MGEGFCDKVADALNCKGRRGRPKVSEDNRVREKIAGEASRLFGECGYEGMKMDDLAARCQMSKRTLYRLFPRKRDIFASIAAGHRQAMLNLPFDDDRVDLEVALRHIFRLDIGEDEHVERMCMIRFFKEECPKSVEMTEILKEQGHDVALRYFSQWIARQIVLGRMRALSPENAAKIMLDMFFGALFTSDKKIREWRSSEDRRAYMEECMRIFLNGTRAEDDVLTS
ncbi:TetR/AcrR family transcriptional regulator [Rhizobium laguerreae]|nr:TetR/AcrR family transcriptional regulator [Rhizobium laguerreae]